jgi:hypothetical protein
MAWSFKKARQREAASAYFTSETPLVSYWSYFEDDSVANAAAKRLHALDFSADVQPAAGRKHSWLVIAYRPLPATEDRVEHYSRIVMSVTASLGGQYDGWEAGPLRDEASAGVIKGWLRRGIGRPQARR